MGYISKEILKEKDAVQDLQKANMLDCSKAYFENVKKCK